MHQLLKINQQVSLDTGLSCTVKAFLGGGGQGEVYKAQLENREVALKWYFKEQASDNQKQALEKLIEKGAPNDKFLWPLNLAASDKTDGFGYIMPLRPPHYKSIFDLVKRRAEPSFQHLIQATIELADSFLQLHAKGLCYRDISFGNVFFDPKTGQVLICDNDNVTVNGQAAKAGVLGTPRFMAPEIVLGANAPSTESDLFSLAVLLFYMLMLHHPLEGKKEADIKCFDLPAMNKLYGSEPLFIFAPNDSSNRPVTGYQDNALIYWEIYPQFLKDLFSKAFTAGIKDAAHGRVRETEWRNALIRLKDSLIYCGTCGAENFYDGEKLKQQGQLNPCWGCQKAVQLPPRIRIEQTGGAQVVMLNHDTLLLNYHLDSKSPYDIGTAVAQMVQHPTNPNVWGLKNLSKDTWSINQQDGTIKTIAEGQSAGLASGLKINFGQATGDIRLG